MGILKSIRDEMRENAYTLMDENVAGAVRKVHATQDENNKEYDAPIRKGIKSSFDVGQRMLMTQWSAMMIAEARPKGDEKNKNELDASTQAQAQQPEGTAVNAKTQEDVDRQVKARFGSSKSDPKDIADNQRKIDEAVSMDEKQAGKKFEENKRDNQAREAGLNPDAQTNETIYFEDPNTRVALDMDNIMSNGSAQDFHDKIAFGPGLGHITYEDVESAFDKYTQARGNDKLLYGQGLAHIVNERGGFEFADSFDASRFMSAHGTNITDPNVHAYDEGGDFDRFQSLSKKISVSLVNDMQNNPQMAQDPSLGRDLNALKTKVMGGKILAKQMDEFGADADLTKMNPMQQSVWAAAAPDNLRYGPVPSAATMKEGHALNFGPNGLSLNVDTIMPDDFNKDDINERVSADEDFVEAEVVDDDEPQATQAATQANKHNNQQYADAATGARTNDVDMSERLRQAQAAALRSYDGGAGTGPDYSGPSFTA